MATLQPQRILWPTDFSKLSHKGARYARGVCELFHCELHVIHVIPPLVTPDFLLTPPAEMPSTIAEEEVMGTCRKHLEELVTEHLSGLERVVRDAFFGNAWSAICQYAGQKDVDLIIVSTHGRTGLRHVLIGSTAERIVQHAPCPVLVVKTPEKDFVQD